MSPATRPTLVVLRALGLGDLLTGLPALRALRAAFPGHRRLLLCPEPLWPLALASGAVDGCLPARGLEPLPRPGAPVAVAVNLHGRGPESHRLLLALRPARLVAFRHAAVAESAGGPSWRREEHEVARWCRLLVESGIAADAGRLELELPGEGPDWARGATVVHPGAASPARRWPADRFAAVARREAEAGRTVLVTGGPEERELGLRVARLAGLPEASVLAGRTGLLELARVVAAAGRLVCGDTGVAHLATALGTPSVVLFGPTPPALWGPPPGARHRVLWAGEEGDPHGERPDPGLLRIGVEQVLAELALLEPAAA